MQLPILECLKAFLDQQNDVQSHIDQIIENDENRRKAFDQIGRSHDKMKAAFKHTQAKPSNPVILYSYGTKEERILTCTRSGTTCG